MMYRRDVEARLDDLAALTSARDAGELHRALVLGPPAAYERQPTLPLHSFRTVHEHSREGSVVTALLLITDPRWVPASGPLISRLESTGLITDEELDLLAQTFLAAGPHVYWACPDDWFGGPEIVISLDDQPIEADRPPIEAIEFAETPSEDDHGALVARAVPSGARRWAAERALRSAPFAWGQILRRARDAGSQAGAAIMQGLLDAIDTLPPAAVDLIQTRALAWGRADVRHAALHLLAETDPDAAHALGAQDANDTIRKWAAGCSRARSGPCVDEATRPPLPSDTDTGAPAVQPALF